MKQITKCLGVVLLTVLGSCMTTQKSVAYLQQHKQMAAQCALLYPCVASGTDSAQYKKALAYYDSLLVWSEQQWDSTQASNEKLVARIDSLKNSPVVDTSLFSYIAQLEVENVRLSENCKPKLIHLPPVIQFQVDSSGKQALREAVTSANELAQEKTVKAVELNTKWVDARESKIRWMGAAIGTWAILLLLLIVYIYAKKK